MCQGRRDHAEDPDAFASAPDHADIRVFRMTPMVICVLDHSKGFAHTNLVTCQVDDQAVNRAAAWPAA